MSFRKVYDKFLPNGLEDFSEILSMLSPFYHNLSLMFPYEIEFKDSSGMPTKRTKVEVTKDVQAFLKDGDLFATNMKFLDEDTIVSVWSSFTQSEAEYLKTDVIDDLFKNNPDISNDQSYRAIKDAWRYRFLERKSAAAGLWCICYLLAYSDKYDFLRKMYSIWQDVACIHKDTTNDDRRSVFAKSKDGHDLTLFGSFAAANDLLKEHITLYNEDNVIERILCDQFEIDEDVCYIVEQNLNTDSFLEDLERDEAIQSNGNGLYFLNDKYYWF